MDSSPFTAVPCFLNGKLKEPIFDLMILQENGRTLVDAVRDLDVPLRQEIYCFVFPPTAEDYQYSIQQACV